jgi:hypothetical protein
MCARRGLAAAFAVGVLACRRDNPVRPATDVAPVAIGSLTSADLARKVDKPVVGSRADVKCVRSAASVAIGAFTFSNDGQGGTEHGADPRAARATARIGQEVRKPLILCPSFEEGPPPSSAPHVLAQEVEGTGKPSHDAYRTVDHLPLQEVRLREWLAVGESRASHPDAGDTLSSTEDPFRIDLLSTSHRRHEHPLEGEADLPPITISVATIAPDLFGDMGGENGKG